MTAVDVEMVCETWELTLPEDEAKCEWAPCLRSAAWVSINTCCGERAIFCDPCRDKCNAWTATNPWKCTACKTPMPIERWVRI